MEYGKISSLFSGAGMGAFLAFLLALRFPDLPLEWLLLFGIAFGVLLGFISKPAPSSGAAFPLGLISALLASFTIVHSPSMALFLSVLPPLLLFLLRPSGIVDVLASPLAYLGGVVVALWLEYVSMGGLTDRVLGMTAYLEILGATVAFFTPLSRLISLTLSKRLQAKL